eukprot:2975965-Pleurochrysis_carterae.AAC.2
MLSAGWRHKNKSGLTDANSASRWRMCPHQLQTSRDLSRPVYREFRAGLGPIVLIHKICPTLRRHKLMRLRLSRWLSSAASAASPASQLNRAASAGQPDRTALRRSHCGRGVDHQALHARYMQGCA